MTNKHIYILPWCLLLVLLLLNWHELPAQCAMCRVVAESSPDENNIRSGLNSGILYLLAVPYALIAAFGIFFFREKIGAIIRGLKKNSE